MCETVGMGQLMAFAHERCSGRGVREEIKEDRPITGMKCRPVPDFGRQGCMAIDTKRDIHMSQSTLCSGDVCW